MTKSSATVGRVARRGWILAVGIGALVALHGASSSASQVASAQEPAERQADDACGKSGLPDCPLQGWMKTNLVAAKAAGDMAKLETAFRKVATLAPKGSGWDKEWSALALGGAEAAKKGDKDAVAKTCTDCHAKFRKEYREKYRTTPVGG